MDYIMMVISLVLGMIITKLFKVTTVRRYMVLSYIQTIAAMIFFYLVAKNLYALITDSSFSTYWIGTYNITELYFFKIITLLLILIVLLGYSAWRHHVHRSLFGKHRETLWYSVFHYTLFLTLSGVLILEVW